MQRDSAHKDQTQPKAANPNTFSKIRRATEKWKWAYYSLAIFNLVTIGAAFLFSRTLASQYKATIETDDFWSTTITKLVKLNDTIIAANMPGNEVFDTLDPVLERHYKHVANMRFKETLASLRAHLEEAPNHLDQIATIDRQLTQIESEFRILDARAQAIFDSISMGELGIAGSIMASMDRTASDCAELLSQTTHTVSDLQKKDFKTRQTNVEKRTYLEILLSVAVVLAVIVGLLFGRRMFSFLDVQAAESLASQRRADKARHELSSQTYALDQHSIVAITDTSGRIQYVNDKFCDISKYFREELLGQDHRILNSGHHPQSFFAEMYKTVANGRTWRAEVKNKAKDGSFYWVDTTIVPYRDEAGRIDSYVAIRTDITDRKHAQRQLAAALENAKEASEEAEKANRAKSDFLATMSHEIRTPMNSVIGFSNLLLDSGLPESSQKFARSILSSGQSLLAIINDILDFSKIEAGKLEIETMPFDLRQTAEEAVELLANQASVKNLELLLRYDPQLPRGFNADPGRVRQIIINLAGNAVKFTKSGHVYIEIAPHPDDPQSFARISVSDTGIGIPEDAQEKLFTKFTQADSSTSRDFGGTGLGLAICKQLSELMGGEIKLESQLGKGSTFWFTLPIPALPVELLVEAQPPNVSGNRILIVDDYPLNRRLLAEQCRQWGLTCDCAADAKEALQKVQQATDEGDPYKIALIDYCMPEMDGLELGKTLLRNPETQSTKLIIIAPGTALAERARFIETGFDAFFLKPIIKPELLRSAIARALGISCEGNAADSSLTRPAVSEVLEGNFRILIVDDTALNQILLRSILEEKYGYRVDTAANGQEAVDLCKEFRYNVIFMDCMMPVMDGFEATKKIREKELLAKVPKTPIVALTANALLGDEQKCYAAGMDAYLSKPINQTELSAILRRLLEAATSDSLQSEKNQSASTLEEQPDPAANYLDTDQLKSIFPDNSEIQSQILTAYSQTLAESEEKAKSYTDLEQLRLVSHTIKGSSANCGATLLSEIAAQVETACRQSESDALPELLAKLHSTMDRTRECVESALASLR